MNEAHREAQSEADMENIRATNSPKESILANFVLSRDSPEYTHCVDDLDDATVIYVWEHNIRCRGE